jgi:O-antigen ligase
VDFIIGVDMVKQINGKINLSVLYNLILLLAFFPPAIVNSLETGSFVVLLFKLLKPVALILLLFQLTKGKKIYHHREILFVILYCFLLFLSACINSTDYIDSLKSGIITILGCYVIFIILKDNFKYGLQSILILFEVYITLNFLSIILFPNGIITNVFPVWILGVDNAHIVPILLGLTVSIVYSYYTSEKMLPRTVVLLVLATLSVLIRKSATGVIGLLSFYFIYMALIAIIKKVKVFKLLKYIYVLYIILFFCIVIFNLQNLFSWLVVDIMHKDITLSYRTYIWEYIIDLIKAKPFFGYGNIKSFIVYFLGWPHEISHAHNLALNIIYKGGLLSFSIIILNFLEFNKNLKKIKNEKIAYCIVSFIFSILIVSLTEVFNMDYLFLMFILVAVMKGMSVDEDFNNCASI